MHPPPPDLAFRDWSHPGPPRSNMSLEEYCDFCWCFLKDADPDRIRAQKQREEQIEHRFTLQDEEPAPRSEAPEAADVLPDATASDMKTWVATWRGAADELERIRMDDLRNADTPRAIRAFEGLLLPVLSSHPPASDSGLVEQQSFFSTLRS